MSSLSDKPGKFRISFILEELIIFNPSIKILQQVETFLIKQKLIIGKKRAAGRIKFN